MRFIWICVRTVCCPEINKIVHAMWISWLVNDLNYYIALRSLSPSSCSIHRSDTHYVFLHLFGGSEHTRARTHNTHGSPAIEMCVYNCLWLAENVCLPSDIPLSKVKFYLFWQTIFACMFRGFEALASAPTELEIKENCYQIITVNILNDIYINSTS